MDFIYFIISKMPPNLNALALTLITYSAAMLQRPIKEKLRFLFLIGLNLSSVLCTSCVMIAFQRSLGVREIVPILDRTIISLSQRDLHLKED